MCLPPAGVTEFCQRINNVFSEVQIVHFVTLRQKVNARLSVSVEALWIVVFLRVSGSLNVVHITP
jgi:hypothetical protein